MRRLVKWLLVAWVAGEFYTRGGRELLFGDAEPELPGVQDSFTQWVDLPRVLRWDEANDVVGWEVRDRDGGLVGQVIDYDAAFATRDGAGYPATVARVRVIVDRSKLGWPINVAQAQVFDFTRMSLGLG